MKTYTMSQLPQQNGNVVATFGDDIDGKLANWCVKRGCVVIRKYIVTDTPRAWVAFPDGVVRRIVLLYNHGWDWRYA